MTVRVEVAWGDAVNQKVVMVELDDGASAAMALKKAGFFALKSEAANGVNAEVGNTNLLLSQFGKRIKPGTTMQDGGRVEVLRPLVCDPKEARRLRSRSANK